MASRIFSIRLDDRVVEALEALKLPDDDSLNTTLKRFVIDSLGIDVNSPVHTVNSNERLQELVDFKTAYLADAMNEIKHSLEGRTEALESEVQALKLRLDSLTSSTPITAKTVAIPTAIATKATNIRPTCPHCQSTVSIGNGKDRHGLPRYKCKDCGKTFTWS